jgi:tetratricopeptide (TPR) repeat protein
MNDRDLWSEWVEPYDLFVSYARADNAAPVHMVTALVESIEAAFRRFSADPPLRVFFDKRAILDGQHWERVLKRGVRQSKVMLAVLSEAYFRSEWCRREWEEYVLVEQSRTYPGEALTPIFIVAPGDLAKVVPPEARDWWDDVTARNAVVEVHPFWPNGMAALQEKVVADRIEKLCGNVWARVQHGRELAKVPRNVRGRNPNFVGRRKELAVLRDALSRFEMAGVCAVNGVGGVGKSTLAREYAYLFRRDYLGGQFEVSLAGVTDARGVRPPLVGIARDYLNADIPTNISEESQYERARAAFAALPPGHTALLILDNLDESAVGLVGAGGRDLLPCAEKVHLLVTTRAEPRALGGLATVSLDVLPAADALDLLFRYRPYSRRPDDRDYLRARDDRFALSAGASFDGEAEWKAALAIANRLGRHSLAVALVGAYLRSYPDVSYAQFASELATHGIGLALDAVGSDEKVRNLIQHPETLVGPLFERSVGRLGPLALRVLEYASFLPADLIPLSWVKALVEADAAMAEHLKPRPFRPPPWEEALRTLAGLQYLTGGPYARMHRVVQEVIRRRTGDEAREQRRDAVFAYVADLSGRNWDDTMKYADVKDVEAVEETVREHENGGERRLGQAALWLVYSLLDLGKLRNARDLARIAERILRAVADADPASAEKQRDLSFSFNRLGDVSAAVGDLAAARRYFEQGLGIAQTLADADPASAQKRRDLSVSFNKLGDVSAAAGDLAAARRYYEQSLALRERLADNDPASAEKQRDLSVSFERLGDVSAAVGDLAAARRYFEQGLGIAQTLADADPASAQKRRDLSVSFNKLGDVSVAANDLAAARRYYEQYSAIAQALAADAEASAEKQRDLSVSFERLGNVSVAAGDLAAARRYFEQSLALRERLAEADPTSAEKQRDLSIAFNKLGDVSVAAGDLAAARRYFEQSLALRERLAKADPASAQKQRDLGVSHFKLCDLANKQDDRLAAREHLEAFVAVWGQLEAENRLPSPKDQRILNFRRKQLADWDAAR